MTKWTHIGGYSYGFVDGTSRYVVTTRRADGLPITSDELSNAKRANIRAARGLGLTGRLATRPVWDSVTVGSYTLRGSDMVSVESLAAA